MADKNTLKNWFKTGLKPTQEQFWAWIDSFYHKDEKIPITAIDGIENILQPNAKTILISDTYSKSNYEWNVVPGDNLEEGIGKLAHALDLLLLKNSGFLNVFVKSNNLPVHGEIEVRNAGTNTIVFSGGTSFGTLSNELPIGKYDVTIIAPGYDLISTTVVDGSLVDNITQGTTCKNIDINAFDSNVTFNIKPSFAPTINTFTINEGAVSTSNSALRLNIGTVGVVSEISVSRLESMVGTTWLPYTGGDYSYNFPYVDNIQLILFIKVRNITGQSNTMTASINVVNGLVRSDSAKTYNSIANCIDDILAEYPTGLTNDVTITATDEVVNVNTASLTGMIRYIESWNAGSNYYLHIKGQKKFTIDCQTGGAFRMLKVDNIIFSGINFINVCNYHEYSKPEVLSALYIQSCNNIAIDNCTFDGVYPKNPALEHGRYGIVAIDCNSINVTDCAFSKFGLRALDIQFVKVFSLLKTTISNCTIIRDRIGQPAIIELKEVDIIKIEDCVLDGALADTIISGLNIKRVFINRTKLINCPGEIISLFNTKKSEILSIKNCLIKNNLYQVYYPWTKQNVEIDNIEVVEVINCNVKLSPVNGNNMYAKFIRANQRIGTLNSFNNVFEISMPGFTNNVADAGLFEMPVLDVLNSNYNIYKDYSLNADAISNNILNVTSTSSIVKLSRSNSLTKLRAAPYLQDINSIVVSTTIPLYTNDDESLPLPVITNAGINSLILPKFDIKRFVKTGNGNPGAYYFNGVVGTNQVAIEYAGIYTPTNSNFQETDLNYIVNSAALTLLSVDKYDDYGLYKWTFSSAGSPDIVAIGHDVSVALFSNNNSNGTYIANRSYALNIEKI
ncbi:hypothetical protein [Flavobacterium soyangense]|uniref:Uncharacterized protein n=1 Tax=Flavobacterium soyangense TaxID=2023265 RepID=A0A930UDD5_9FLAO|nr:hypothetical protein [Flavobacterium soyangense]MBF2708792.1 hypothetical protein [Flavobacterium soyangense]